MKCLSICNGQAFFTDKEGNQQPLDKITKDDILFLIDAITDPEREKRV